MERMLKAIVVSTAMISLSACVTQSFEENDKPVVQNESTDNEIALTRISLGLGYLKMGNTTQAKFNLEKAKRFSPNLVQVYTAFAHYYESVGEDELTIQSYEKALSLKPEDADTLNNYGVFLCRKERLEDAEKQFLRAINVPTYLRVSESYENLALCQLGAFNFEKAELYLGKAIAHSPSNASALYQMMRFQYAIAEYETAKLYSKRFEKVSRRFNAEFLALAYKIYLKLGDTRIATNYGTMLVKMHPQSWYAKQYLLNNLESIDADDLAVQYQILVKKSHSNTETKKVVVLSPTTKAPIIINKQTSNHIPSKHTRSTRNNIVQENKTLPPSTQTHDDKRVSFASPEEKTIVALTPKKKTKRTVVLKAPKRNSREAIADGDLSVEEQVEALAAITDETAKLERQSTDTLFEQIVQSTENEAQALNDERLSETETGDDEIEAILAEAEALLASNNYSETISDESNVDDTFVDNDTGSASTRETQINHPTMNETDTFFIAEKEEIMPIDAAIAEELPQALEAEELLDETLSQLAQNTPDNIDGNLSGSVQSEESETVVDTLLLDSESTVQDTYRSLDDLPVHIISDGENLFAVSKRYNIHLHALRSWNELNEKSVLQVGDSLYLADPSLVVTGKE